MFHCPCRNHFGDSRLATSSELFDGRYSLLNYGTSPIRLKETPPFVNALEASSMAFAYFILSFIHSSSSKSDTVVSKNLSIDNEDGGKMLTCRS